MGHVLLCKILSGSGYRLRPTSKIGEFTRDSSLLSKFGISLAEACRAGIREGWRTGPRERFNGYVVSAARQARCLPGRIRKTSRRVDRPERALVAPIKRTKQASKRRRLKRTICEIKGGLRRAQGAHGAWPTLATYSRGEQLWCYRNTLKFFMQRHITGRIAWSHPKYQRIGGAYP